MMDGLGFARDLDFEPFIALEAVPYVVDAEPGLLSSLDLPVTVPVGGFA